MQGRFVLGSLRDTILTQMPDTPYAPVKQAVTIDCPGIVMEFYILEGPSGPRVGVKLNGFIDQGRIDQLARANYVLKGQIAEIFKFSGYNDIAQNISESTAWESLDARPRFDKHDYAQTERTRGEGT